MSKIRPSTQLEQDGATDGDVLVYDATNDEWVPLARYEIFFSMAGAVSTGSFGPAVARYSSTLVEVQCLLTVSGSTSTVVSIRKNGTEIGTVTLAAGETTHTTAFSTAFVSKTDVLTAAVTTAGTSASTLTVIARFA